MGEEQIFWRDYFYTVGQAIQRLQEAIQKLEKEHNEYMRDSCIKRFEFTIEIFWKALKKILAYEKVETSGSPRDVIRQSYQFKLIDDEKIWLIMWDDRNRSTHLYSEEEAEEICRNVKKYLPVFEKTHAKLKKQYKL